MLSASKNSRPDKTENQSHPNGVFKKSAADRKPSSVPKAIRRVQTAKRSVIAHHLGAIISLPRTVTGTGRAARHHAQGTTTRRNAAVYPSLFPEGNRPGRSSFGPNKSIRTQELLDLARSEVFRAPSVTRRAGRSYRTFSPLPVPTGIETPIGHRRYIFCGTLSDPRQAGRWA